MRSNPSMKRLLLNITPVLTTRGCPYSCEFCTVFIINGKNIRHVPVRNVVQYITDSKGKNFLFLDDNIVGDPRYARELFKAIKPLNIKWIGQASISFVHDTELLKLASESGCKVMFFGLESVSPPTLQRMVKSIKQISETEEAIQKVKDFGVHVHASFVFGFDTDSKDIFPETLDFVLRNNIGTAEFHVLTPFPGTRIYERFKAENRIITTDWRAYNQKNVVFRPKNMTPLELYSGRLWVIREFSKLSSISRRLNSIPKKEILGIMMYLGMNLAHGKAAKGYIKEFRAKTADGIPLELDGDGTCHLNTLKALFQANERRYRELKYRRQRDQC